MSLTKIILITLVISQLYSCSTKHCLSSNTTKPKQITFFQMSTRTLGQDNFSFDTHNTYTLNSQLYILNNNTIKAPAWYATKHTIKSKYITYKNCNIIYGNCSLDTSIKYITINQINRSTTFYYKYTL